MGLSWKATLMSSVLDSARSPVKVLLADADAEARSTLADHLATFCPDHHIVGQATKATEAFRLAREARPDLIMLDVDLADGSGFALLDKLTDENLQVIFTTSSAEHALRAFKYNTVDYLLKPLRAEEVTKAIDRAAQLHAQRLQYLLRLMKSPAISPANKKLALPSQEGLTMMVVEEIVRLESDTGYTTLWTSDGARCLVSRSIGEFEGSLPQERFLRVHTSHVINLNFVKKFLREDGGFALMADGSRVPIARRRKELFLDMLRGEHAF